ncbi:MULTISPECIES: phage tail tape measure protein [unclassified Microbispora]|uniref:phage tail tape measure protein n=1 Tax=unclassified Microbispora TaxID=2614687 RepID=UPI001F112E17|nr:MULTISPECIES: phage tail tape measure protein [unclassified Microbispora]
MTIGELVGFIDLEDKGFGKGVDQAGRGLDRLQSATSSSMSSIEGTVSQALSQIETDIAGGLDPTKAIADLDRLESELDAGLKSMLDEADSFSDELDRAIDEAFDGLPDKARKSGEETGDSFGDGLDKGGKSRMPGIGSSLMGSFKGLGWAAAGTAVAGLLMEGIQSAIEREDLFATLSVKVGAFGPESARLGKIAGELYADAYGESLEDVTDALARVYQNVPGATKLGDDALKKTAGQAITTGKVMDEDLGKVTSAVGQMMKTGLAKNAQEAFDILVRGQQTGINKSEDLLDTFNEYSTIFRDLGLNGKDALGLLGQGLKAGARDSDTVADALKELDIRVKDMSAAKALKSLGLNAKDMQKAFAEGGPKARDALGQILDKLRGVKDPAERSQLAVALFGTKAEDMAKSINALNLDKAKTAVGGFKDAVKTADDTLNNTASASADKWSRSWGDALSAVGGFVLDQIKKFLPSPDEMAEQWNQVTSWFSETVGPFFSGLWEDVKTKTSEAWEKIKTTVSEKGTALVDWLKELPGKIGEFFSSGWESLRTKTSEAWEKIKTAASEKGSALLDWVKELPGKIKDKLGDLGKLLLDAGKDMIQGLIDGIKSVAGKAAEAAKGVAKSAIDGAKALLGIHSPSTVFAEIGMNTVRGFAHGILQEQPRARMTAAQFAKLMKDATSVNLQGAPDAFVEWVKKNNSELKDLADKRAEIIKTIADAKRYADQIAQQMTDFASVANLGLEKGDGAGDIVSGLQTKLDQIKKFANDIKKLASSGLNKTTLSQIINAGPEKGLSLAEMLVGADGSEIKAINKAQGQIDKVSKQMGKNSADALYDVGKKAGDGFLKGLEGKLKETESMMAKIAKAVVDAAKKQLGVKSPSRVFMGIGDNTMLGYIQGVLGQQQATVSAVAGVVGKAAATASRVPGLTPGPMSGPSSAPAYGGEYGAPGLVQPSAGSGVVVHMHDPVVREEADIGRIGAEFAFKYRARG